MANRYWVGGTASWDGTAGTKWAATSNGPGGQTVPTTADDVFFDASSTGTVTIAAGNTGAKSITCTGFAGTIAGSAAITVAGSITLAAGQTYTHSGTVTITGTGTLTTAGKTFGILVVDGAGITVTLGDALNVSTTRTITVTQGTFSTANYSVTAGSLASSNTNTRTITLGSSTLTLSAGTPVNFSTSTNLTFTAGTSQINLSGAAALLNGGGQTFYNVSFTSTASGTRTLSQTNTFNTLTLTAPASAGLVQLALTEVQTVTGTLTCAGATAVRRCFVRSSTMGTVRTLTVNTLSADDCDFRDITIAGSAAGSSPVRAGDCGGNTGITFPAAKTVYWNPTTAAVFESTTAWVTTSGGTDRATNNFPLAQDTAVFDENSGANMNGSSVVVWNVGTIDLSLRTSAFTFAFGTAGFTVYKDWTTGSGVTYSGNVTTTFAGRGMMVLTSAGKTWPGSITVDAPGGTFDLGDAFSSSNPITHSRGVFDANNYSLTCSTFASASGFTRTLTMGSGLWTLSGTGTVWSVGTTNLTFNKDTANILLSDTSTTARTFAGGNVAYNKLTIGGTTGISTTTITGTNTFSELASTKTVAHTISFAGNQTITTWTVTGTSGNVATVNSSVAGTRRTITLANTTSGIDYLSVKDIGISAANRFYVGVNSTDGGNNLNVIFTAAPSAANSNMLFMFR